MWLHQFLSIFKRTEPLQNIAAKYIMSIVISHCKTFGKILQWFFIVIYLP